MPYLVLAAVWAGTIAWALYRHVRVRLARRWRFSPLRAALAELAPSRRRA